MRRRAGRRCCSRRGAPGCCRLGPGGGRCRGRRRVGRRPAWSPVPPLTGRSVTAPGRSSATASGAPLVGAPAAPVAHSGGRSPGGRRGRLGRPAARRRAGRSAARRPGRARRTGSARRPGTSPPAGGRARANWASSHQTRRARKISPKRERDAVGAVRPSSGHLQVAGVDVDVAVAACRRRGRPARGRWSPAGRRPARRSAGRRPWRRRRSTSATVVTSTFGGTTTVAWPKLIATVICGLLLVEVDRAQVERGVAEAVLVAVGQVAVVGRGPGDVAVDAAGPVVGLGHGGDAERRGGHQAERDQPAGPAEPGADEQAERRWWPAPRRSRPTAPTSTTSSRSSTATTPSARKISEKVTAPSVERSRGGFGGFGARRRRRRRRVRPGVRAVRRERRPVAAAAGGRRHRRPVGAGGRRDGAGGSRRRRVPVPAGGRA